MSPFFTERRTRTFYIIWLGETVSAVGSGLTNFALSIWVYEQTRSATLYGLITFLATAPSMLLLPLIGALVDRWELRATMIRSNVCAALCSLAVTILALSHHLAVWHIFVVMFFRAIFMAFIEPSLLKSATLLVPAKNMGRASGLIQSTQAAPLVFSPLLAGVLLPVILIQGIALLDLTSYLFAVVILFSIRLPVVVERAEESKPAQRSLLRDAYEGWSFIAARPGLLALLIYFAFVNFFIGVVLVLLPPLVLNLSSTEALGVVLLCSGVGFLVGSLWVAVWGTPEDHVRGIIGYGLLFTLSGMAIGLFSSVVFIAAAAFAMNLFIPKMNACTQVLWLRKTPVGLQGRVFAVRRLLVLSMMPVSYLVSGPLADRVFEPLASGGGSFNSYLVALLGSRPGRGFSLMIITAGALTLLAQLLSYSFKRLRHVESELPDAIGG